VERDGCEIFPVKFDCSCMSRCREEFRCVGWVESINILFRIYNVKK
jgi:hypothetical protein